MMRAKRTGLSLLEVILSIAILGGSLTVIGHLYYLGYRSALQVRIRSEANILADSVMAQLAGGVIEPSSTSSMPIEGHPNWTYSVSIEPSLQPGLLLAIVEVENQNEVNSVSTGVVLSRFLPDPNYEPEEDEG
ncbi:MAG: hypothetical protein AAF623_03900 [Planctomycetota bacterium]